VAKTPGGNADETKMVEEGRDGIESLLKGSNLGKDNEGGSIARVKRVIGAFSCKTKRRWESAEKKRTVKRLREEMFE